MMFHNLKPELRIDVNGKQVNLLQQVHGDVEYLNIWNDNFPKRVDTGTFIAVKAWLWDLVQRCKNAYVTYNNVAIETGSVRRPH